MTLLVCSPLVAFLLLLIILLWLVDDVECLVAFLRAKPTPPRALFGYRTRWTLYALAVAAGGGRLHVSVFHAAAAWFWLASFDFGWHAVAFILEYRRWRGLR